MKKIFVISFMVLLTAPLWSQEDPFLFNPPKNSSPGFRIPLIGERAPNFTAESTNGIINFPADYGNKWKILFAHPQDFTPVCTSEILEIADLQKEFDDLGVQVVIVSTDSLATNEQWKKSMEELRFKDRQPMKINFPFVSDKDLTVSTEYGMISEKLNTTKSVRGVFIIDPDNIIQAVYFYPMAVGRNIDEIVRTVTALEKTKADHVLTPANWRAGNDVLIPVPPNTSNPPQGYYNLSWYMWYKKAQ